MPLPFLRFLALGLLLAASFPAVGADVASRRERMPFGACLALLAEVAGEFGPEATRVVHAVGLSRARIRAADGDVTLVCREADGSVSLSRSSG